MRKSSLLVCAGLLGAAGCGLPKDFNLTLERTEPYSVQAVAEPRTVTERRGFKYPEVRATAYTYADTPAGPKRFTLYDGLAWNDKDDMYPRNLAAFMQHLDEALISAGLLYRYTNLDSLDRGLTVHIDIDPDNRIREANESDNSIEMELPGSYLHELWKPEQPRPPILF